MADNIALSINLGSGFSGLSLYAQIIRPNGLNVTNLISEGFYEVGEGYYIWEYSNFPENFKGGVKIFNQNDTSKILTFIDISSKDVCYGYEECITEVSDTFDITYSDQKYLNFYALLFSAEDSTKAFNLVSNDFETYTFEDHYKFVINLQEDSNRPGWYAYSISNTENIKAVIGNQYYFIEVWQKKGLTPNRLNDLNTGTLKVCWGKNNYNWLEIAKNVWEYGTRTITDFPEIPPGITPKQIWEYAQRTLTAGDNINCDFTSLEKNILEAIAVSTGKTLEELASVNKELGDSINQTFELLKTCCNSGTTGSPNVQTPRIGQRGTKANNSGIKFT